MIYENSLNFVICGEAGQGIESAGYILARLLHSMNFHTFSMPEYMSRIRGGCNSNFVKVSSSAEPYFSRRIDILLALSKCAREHLKDRIDENTVIIEESKSNFYAAGYALGLFRFNYNDVEAKMKESYSKLFSIEKNNTNFKTGFESALKNTDIEIKITPDNSLEDKIIMSGTEAAGFGCIAGECNFLSFYPMSPATPLSTFLCQNADEFDIITEQAEDEICAINMALGAVFAGARAIVPTAGGGFSLMTESTSLAGMIESPIVINIAQRPGPATGLPTRCAQEDLNLALYAGHGEFPRIILSPSTLDNSFWLFQKAFNLAEKFQVPVFLLTQQDFLDTEYSTDIFETEKVENTCYVIKSDKDYKRYSFPETIPGLSPRAIPDYGEGTVCIDSDEHDEAGQITESADLRKKMTDKRLGKLDLIKKEVIEPDFVGENGYKYLVISWGATYNVLKGAIKDKKEIALLHFTQLYPVSEKLLEYTQNGCKLIIIEQNTYCQYAKLLKIEFGINFDYKFTKYNGEPISVEELQDFFRVLTEQTEAAK